MSDDTTLEPPSASHPQMGVASALLANGLVLAALGLFVLMERLEPDLFYQSVQEDEALEWATVWAFFAACGLFAFAAVEQRRRGSAIPWFYAGVALFCFVVAMEEISWGQRVLGYRPPAYFLEHNFQQELNVHNVIDKSLRMFSVKAILVGYGVVLPILALVPAIGGLLARVGILAPPAALAPSFGAAYAFYEEYPFSFTGEIVEVMMGFAFAFAALAAVYALRGSSNALASRIGLAGAVAVVCVASVGVGTVSAALSRMERSASPHALEAARVELAALGRDFLREAREWGGQLPSDCGAHKRLYSWWEKYDHDFLLVGDFAQLAEQGLPEERAEFLLDPWNSPYWIRDNCEGGSRMAFVYSFGPNRVRDSGAREIAGDDLGIVLLGPGS